MRDPNSDQADGVSNKLRVLVADDNAVNRQVMVALLSRRGHLATAVQTGRQAVEAMRDGCFDLVFMDLQMPELNGLQATELIRQNEGDGGRHVPIIALTAHSAAEEEQRCLRHGMNGVLSKPMRPQVLDALLQKVASGAVPAAMPGGERVVSRVTEAIATVDHVEVLRRFEGDTQCLREAVQAYLEDAPVLMQDIEAALERGDRETISFASHRIKGTLAMFSSRAARDAAAELERVSKAGAEAAVVRDALEQLKVEMVQVAAALREWMTKLER